MLLGARQFFERRGGGGWQNPYVTDGLVAMWDAQWNVGFWKHESNPLLWKDLSGNGLDMISNGSPVFYDNYISPTQQSEMFHTDETNLLDTSLQNATLSMEVVAMCVLGYTQPKFCLFGGGSRDRSCSALAACADATRVGISGRVGTSDVVNYASMNPRGYFAVTSDGTTVTGYYKSGSGTLTKTNSASPPVNNYVSKRFSIGYRYNYYPDSPMTHGERVYCIRVYSRALTAAEIAANYAIDKVRFNLP